MFNRKPQIDDMDAWVEERLSDYLDGTLSPQDRATVEAHLKTSERARASLDALRWTVQLLHQTPAPALPRQFTLPVNQRVPARSAPPWMVWSLRGVAVAATAAFVVLLAATLMRQPPSGDVAMMQQAPAAAPSVMVAMGPSPIPTFSAAGGAQENAADANVPLTPIMITVEPPAPTTEIMPVTVVPPQANAKTKPTEATNVAQDSAPAASTQASSSNKLPAQSSIPQPSPTAAAAIANAPAGTAPELATAEPTATDEAATQRTFGIQSIEGRVATQLLQVHQAPLSDSKVIGELKRGERILVVGRSEALDWLVIQYTQNETAAEGWVEARFLKLNQTPETLPIVLPPDGNAPTQPTLTTDDTAPQTPVGPETSEPKTAEPEATPTVQG